LSQIVKTFFELTQLLDIDSPILPVKNSAECFHSTSSTEVKTWCSTLDKVRAHALWKGAPWVAVPCIPTTAGKVRSVLTELANRDPTVFAAEAVQCGNSVVPKKIVKQRQKLEDAVRDFHTFYNGVCRSAQCPLLLAKLPVSANVGNPRRQRGRRSKTASRQGVKAPTASLPKHGTEHVAPKKSRKQGKVSEKQPVLVVPGEYCVHVGSTTMSIFTRGSVIRKICQDSENRSGASGSV